MPDEGLFGVGTPALATGITQWVAAEADRADLVATLVQRVAERAPVLVHAPAATVLPAIRGGPAFRASHGKAAELHDAAYDLLDAHASLALLLVAPPGALTDWTRDVDADFPVLAVVGEPTPGAGAIVRCARVDGAWVITPA